MYLWYRYLGKIEESPVVCNKAKVFMLFPHCKFKMKIHSHRTEMLFFLKTIYYYPCGSNSMIFLYILTDGNRTLIIFSYVLPR